MEKQILVKSNFEDGVYMFPFSISKEDLHEIEIWLTGKLKVITWSLSEYDNPYATIITEHIIKRGFWGDQSEILFKHSLSGNLIKKKDATRTINIDFIILKPGNYKIKVVLDECAVELELYLEKRKTTEEGIELDVGLQSYKILGYRVHLIRKLNILYALKDFSHVDRKSLEVFKKSISNWTKCNHPNIVNIVGLNFEPKSYVIMEYVDGGDLRKLIKETGKLKLKKALGIFCDVVKAMNYAHNMNPPVIHRDLKPENILLTSSGMAKVSDWASSCNPTTGVMLVGTTGYMAPESFGKGEYGVKSDVFALGIILYETLTGERPLPGMTLDLRNKVADLPQNIGELISKMLRQDPSARPDTDEILKELEKSLKRGEEVDSGKD